MITNFSKNCNKKNDASLKKGHACIRETANHINENDQFASPFLDNFELRPYQTECIESIENSTARRQAIVIPTGGGKTVIFASHALRHNSKTLVVAHRRELIQQTKETFLKLDPSCSVGIVMGKQNETNAQITIASIQTLARRNRLRQLPTDYDLIICDEAHHATADSYRRLFYRYGFIDLYACGIENASGLFPFFNENRKLLGVTATPDRTDKESLDAIFDEIVYRISIADLIPDYLSDFRCITRDAGVDISHVRSTAGDLNQEELGKAIEDGGLLDSLPNVITESLSDRKHTLIFLPTVDASIEATRILNEAGITAACVLGITPPEERKQMLTDFRDGKIRVLINCLVLTEGFDCPCIDALIVARPTKSGLLIQQMVGRGLRKSLGKKDCLILDLAFKRRQQDLISVAASGIFGGFQDLEFTREDMSILELIEFQKERAPLLQGLHNVLSQRIVKLESAQENVGIEVEKDDETDDMYDFQPVDIPANDISEGVLLLVDTAILRRICGVSANLGDVWTRLTHALAQTPSHMRTKPATDKQKSLLASRFDFDWNDLNMLNRADASALIGTLLDFEQPTLKQVRWLRYRGVPNASIPTTKAAAIQMISELWEREM